MLYWLIATLLESLETIFRKKSLNLNKMPQFLFTIIWYIGDFIWAFLIIIFWFFNFNLINNFEVIWIIFFLVIIQIIATFFEQYLYKNEKVSALMPYEYLSSIFIIILSFFIFKDVSILTLIITLFAVIIITLFSIDLKNISVPKSFKLILLRHSIYTVKFLAIWYLLLSITNFDYFAIFTFIFFIISLTVFIKNKYYKVLKKWTKAFFNYRLLASFLWIIVELITLFIISNMWLIVATLLWFLWLASTLIFWYFILKEKPEKKDIFLALIVLSLISIWYYFK